MKPTPESPKLRDLSAIKDARGGFTAAGQPPPPPPRIGGGSILPKIYVQAMKLIA
jgi:hypothetical protein